MKTFDDIFAPKNTQNVIFLAGIKAAKGFPKKLRNES